MLPCFELLFVLIRNFENLRKKSSGVTSNRVLFALNDYLKCFTHKLKA